jgi:uncharacterized protein YbjQ (UPF0145 family)
VAPEDLWPLGMLGGLFTVLARLGARSDWLALARRALADGWNHYGSIPVGMPGRGGRAVDDERRAGREGTPVVRRAGRVALVAADRPHRPRRPTGMGPNVAPMLISTMNDLPGYEIEEVYGEVFGLTVRSRNIGSQIGATFKSLVGGELRGMTKMLGEGRRDATERLVEEAEAKGANAVVAFRFDTSELGTTWTEICAYGTAVRARKL